jgi:hypothetical protein
MELGSNSTRKCLDISGGDILLPKGGSVVKSARTPGNVSSLTCYQLLNATLPAFLLDSALFICYTHAIRSYRLFTKGGEEAVDTYCRKEANISQTMIKEERNGRILWLVNLRV